MIKRSHVVKAAVSSSQRLFGEIYLSTKACQRVCTAEPSEATFGERFHSTCQRPTRLQAPNIIAASTWKCTRTSSYPFLYLPIPSLPGTIEVHVGRAISRQKGLRLPSRTKYRMNKLWLTMLHHMPTGEFQLLCFDHLC